MQLSLQLCILIAAATCFYDASGQVPESVHVTIDAAYCYRGGPDMDAVFLFAGKMVLYVEGKHEAFTAQQSNLNIPEDIHLQAAFIPDPRTADARYYYGDKYGYYVVFGSDIRVRKLKYGPKRAFIRNGGPDAAGRRNKKVHFFKACKMAIRHSWNKWELALKDVKTIGLPCNVDAAWGETEGAMVILKGDQFWRWETDGSVSGPHAFHETYHLKSWTLKPSEDSK